MQFTVRKCCCMQNFWCYVKIWGGTAPCYKLQRRAATDSILKISPKSSSYYQVGLFGVGYIGTYNVVIGYVVLFDYRHFVDEQCTNRCQREICSSAASVVYVTKQHGCSCWDQWPRYCSRATECWRLLYTAASITAD